MPHSIKAEPQEAPPEVWWNGHAVGGFEPDGALSALMTQAQAAMTQGNLATLVAVQPQAMLASRLALPDSMAGCEQKLARRRHSGQMSAIERVAFQRVWQIERNRNINWQCLSWMTVNLTQIEGNPL